MHETMATDPTFMVDMMKKNLTGIVPQVCEALIRGFLFLLAVYLQCIAVHVIEQCIHAAGKLSRVMSVIFIVPRICRCAAGSCFSKQQGVLLISTRHDVTVLGRCSV
jgi:hypothetical protein